MKNKFLAFTLIAFAGTAQAEAIMWSLNTEGNKIVLTDEFCNNGKSMVAYIAGPKIDTITGCWTNDAISIHVMWSGQYLRSYDYLGWTIVKKDKPSTM